MSHVMVPLEDHFNNAGISFSEPCHRGDFDGLGNSFPAEKLPAFGDESGVQRYAVSVST